MQGSREGDGCSVWDVAEVVFDVGQVAVIVYYGIVVLDMVLRAELRSGGLVQGSLDLQALRELVRLINSDCPHGVSKIMGR